MIGEERTRRLLFLNALDDADTDNLMLGDADWKRARHQGITGEEDAQRLDSLAEAAYADLERRHGPVPAQWWQAPWRLLRQLLFPLALLVGLGTNYLGPAGDVNLLLNPFMALLLWNLAIYLLLVLRSLMRRKAGYNSNTAGGLLVRLAERLAALPLTSSKGHAPKRRLLLSARLRFLHDWHEAFPILSRRRAAALLHGTAAFLALGVIAGLYIRGLAQAYTFQWPSTFLTVEDEATRQTILQILFGPALLIGGPLFDGMPTTSSQQNGAAWIHLFAFATFLYIAVPRAVLAFWMTRRAGKAAQSASPPTDRAWSMRLLAPLRGKDRHLMVTTYSYSLSDAQEQGVATLARALWGENLAGMQTERVAWGEEEPAWPEPDSAMVRMLVFNGVQTPEQEVHGTFVHAARTQTGPVPLLVVVDAGRINESEKPGRRDDWLVTLGTGAVWVNLEEPGAADLEAAAVALQRSPL